MFYSHEQSPKGRVTLKQFKEVFGGTELRKITLQLIELLMKAFSSKFLDILSESAYSSKKTVPFKVLISYVVSDFFSMRHVLEVNRN
jgi:hypothetical protein